VRCERLDSNLRQVDIRADSFGFGSPHSNRPPTPTTFSSIWAGHRDRGSR
jgi:hypothetical protein